MSVRQALYERTSGNAAVRAIVGDNTFTMRAPQKDGDDERFPRVVIRTGRGETTRTMSGRTGLSLRRVSFECCGYDLGILEQLAEAVGNVWNTVNVVSGGEEIRQSVTSEGPDEDEVVFAGEEEGVFVIPVDAEVWHRQSAQEY